MKDLKEKLILLILGGGFLITALEVRYLHRFALLEYPLAWSPIVYGIIAAVACFIALGIKQRPAWPLAVIFFLGIPVSGIGMYMHMEDHPNALRKLVGMPISGKDRGDGPPVLAPLSLGGLAMIGLVLTGLKEGKKSS
jgi:hypothetical protein